MTASFLEIWETLSLDKITPLNKKIIQSLYIPSLLQMTSDFSFVSVATVPTLFGYIFKKDMSLPQSCYASHQNSNE